LTRGAEYWLKLKFALSDNTLWADAGHVVAWDQFKVPFDVPKPEALAPENMHPIDITEKPDKYIVKGRDFVLSICKQTGAIDAMNYKGKDLISSPLVPNFWRVPLDNDLGEKFSEKAKLWKIAGPDQQITKIKAHQIKPQIVRINIASRLPVSNSFCEYTYTIFGSGDVIVQTILNIGEKGPELPRLGMTMQMPGCFDTVTWYGRGPHETYWDRKTSGEVGLYSAAIKDQIHHYVRPQENGNKTDVRWVALTNREGFGFLAVGMGLLNFSAWPYTMEDLEKAKHINELPQRNTITVNLDYKQMGVGGDDGWTAKARPHPQYRLPAKTYSYSFRLRPYSKNLGGMPDIARQDFQ